MPCGTAKSQPGAPVQSPLVMQNDASTSSMPPNADIEIDERFYWEHAVILRTCGGVHTVRVTKNGYKPWDRKVKASRGAARLVAELETMPGMRQIERTAQDTDSPYVWTKKGETMKTLVAALLILFASASAAALPMSWQSTHTASLQADLPALEMHLNMPSCTRQAR
jgi:hypothetical protein